MDLCDVRLDGGGVEYAAASARACGRGVCFVYRVVACRSASVANYNAKQFGDPLDFMRGPYSAKAIDARTTAPGSPHYPGWHSIRVASLYFLKTAEMGAV